MFIAADGPLAALPHWIGLGLVMVGVVLGILGARGGGWLAAIGGGLLLGAGCGVLMAAQLLPQLGSMPPWVAVPLGALLGLALGVVGSRARRPI